MNYGTIKVDQITFTNAGVDDTLTVSGIMQSMSGSMTVTGTVQGETIIGTSTVSGATVTGNIGQFTVITGGSAGFTTITGTTVTGTTANFVSGVFSAEVSGLTVRGTTVSGATVTGDVGSFATLTGGVVTLTSGVFGAGTAALPSISFSGDPNTGIYSPGADQVAISTAGSGRFFVSDTKVQVSNPGNTAEFDVGAGATGNNFAVVNLIGDTTYPTFGLRIIRINAGANADSQINHRGTGPLALNAIDAGNIQFKTTNTERLRITSAGLVGIGTSSPDNLLSVRSTSEVINYTAADFRSNAAGTGLSNTYIKLEKGSGFGGAIGGFIEQGVGSGLKLSTLNSGTISDVVVIRDTGRVGIGTTSPGNTLDISPGSAGDVLRIRGGTGGTSIVQFTDNTASAQWGTIATTSSSADLTHSSVVRFLTASSERARIDSSGRLLVGTSTSTNVIGVESGLQVQGTGAGSFITSARWANSADNPGFLFAKSRGASVGTRGVVSNGDALGILYFTGDDGTNFVQAATIQASVDGTPGANDMPGRLVFSTTADGASSPTERMRIAQNGVITIQNGAVAVIGTLTDAATITPDLAADCNFTVTLGGSRTIANPTNITAGQSGSIFIVQDATGSRTLSWGSYWDFPGGTAPTLSTAANAIDRVDYIVRSATSIHTVFTANYS
jgi:hypothetical protein